MIELEQYERTFGNCLIIARKGGVLSPGSGPGESDFLIRVADGKANSLIVYAENYGSKSAGRYRYGLQGELGNLGGSGAKVDFGVLISNKH